MIRSMRQVLAKKSSTNFQLDSLDGLRGVAVLFVLAGHLSHSGMLGNVNLDGLGTIGVYCFFVLSSFLLAMPLIRLGPQRLCDRAVWMNYTARRLLRIFPLYTVVLLFYFALSLSGVTPSSAGLYLEWHDLLRHFFLLDAKEYLWTIQVETKFYLVLPLLVAAIVGIFRSRLPYVMIAGAVFMGAIVTGFAGSEDRASLPYQLPVFIAGIMAATIFTSITTNRRLPDTGKRWGDLLAIGILVLILSLIPAVSAYLYQGAISESVLKKPWLFGILWSAFLLCCLYGRGRMNRLLDTGFLRFVGVISFSVYLWHVPILALAKRVSFLNGPVTVPVVLALIVLVSTASYLTIERPFLQIKVKKSSPDVRANP